MKIYKIANLMRFADKQLQLIPLMVEEIAIDFEYYEEHYDDPNSPEAMLEKGIYEKLTSGNFSFSGPELKLIGQTLLSIDTKDTFYTDPKAKRQLFNVQLQLGMWNPITDEEARNHVRNGMGVKMSHFPKVNGIRYDFNDQWENQF